MKSIEKSITPPPKAEKIPTEFNNFERSIENKRQLLKDNMRSVAKKLTAICERQAKLTALMNILDIVIMILTISITN